MMKTENAIAFFTRVNEANHRGVKRLAEQLSVTPSLIYMWGEFVPDKHAARLHLLTRGALDSGIKPLTPSAVKALQ